MPSATKTVWLFALVAALASAVSALALFSAVIFVSRGELTSLSWNQHSMIRHRAPGEAPAELAANAARSPGDCRLPRRHCHGQSQ